MVNMQRRRQQRLLPAVNADTVKQMHDAANSQASTKDVHVYIDGKEIAAHIVGGESTGPAGINTSAMRPNPGMGSYGMPSVA